MKTQTNKKFKFVIPNPHLIFITSPSNVLEVSNVFNVNLQRYNKKFDKKM